MIHLRSTRVNPPLILLGTSSFTAWGWTGTDHLRHSKFAGLRERQELQATLFSKWLCLPRSSAVHAFEPEPRLGLDGLWVDTSLYLSGDVTIIL